MNEDLQRIEAKLDAIIGHLNLMESDQTFVGPDEALKILGYKPNRTARRRLQFLRDTGHLKQFTCRRPYNYQRGELLAALKLIQSGELIVPTKF